MVEIWKTVPGYGDKYKVSNLGRVVGPGGHNQGPRLLKPQLNHKGYTKVCLTVNGKQVSRTVHRLVLLAFVGPCPEGYQCAHLDGNPENNKPENLRWVTPKENTSHKKIHGTELMGVRNLAHKLTEVEVKEIRERHAKGESYKSLGRAYGAADNTIRSACIRETWRHVE